MIAYNAALKYCTILLYAEGYGPKKTLQHFRMLHASTLPSADPRPGLDYLKQEIPVYWDRLHAIIALLNFSHKPSVNMEHWEKDAEAAHLLLGAVEGDGV